jgi:hypothetical protein
MSSGRVPGGDLLGVVSELQALRSETSIDRLHVRVVQVLGTMTGATGVHLVVWDDRQGWLLPAADSGGVPVGGTGHETAAPLSVSVAIHPAGAGAASGGRHQLRRPLRLRSLLR